MKLMTKELEERFKAVGSQEMEEDPLIIAKFFDPCGSWSWFAYEYDPEERTFFGMVHGFEKELGSFSLDELESIRRPLGLTIERDLHFGEKRLSQIR